MSSFRDKLKANNDMAVYVRPEVLPPFIAFKALGADRIDNKSKPGQKSNVVFLEYKPGLKLQFYGDFTFQKLNATDMHDLNEAIKSGEQWFAVSYGQVGDNFISKLLTHAEISSFRFPVFDPASHSLLPPKDKGATSPLNSPAKRLFSE